MDTFESHKIRKRIDEIPECNPEVRSILNELVDDNVALEARLESFEEFMRRGEED